MLEDPYDYQPQPGTRFWGWTLIAWLFVVGLFGAGVATCAQGAEVFRAKDLHDRPMALKLLSDPCPESVAKWLPIRVKEEFRAGMRAAILTWGGRDWAACWIELEGDVHSIDEEGVLLNDGEGTPRRFFRDDSV